MSTLFNDVIYMVPHFKLYYVRPLFFHLINCLLMSNYVFIWSTNGHSHIAQFKMEDPVWKKLFLNFREKKSPNLSYEQMLKLLDVDNRFGQVYPFYLQSFESLKNSKTWKWIFFKACAKKVIKYGNGDFQKKTAIRNLGKMPL